MIGTAHEQRGWAIETAVVILRPMLTVAMRRDWTGVERIPASGGCVVVCNHVSHLDPLTAAHLVTAAGRTPRYLAKSGLFRNKWLGAYLRAAGQIPVERMTTDAVGAFDAAVVAVREGGCVIVYPEGTITRDPDGWPMRGKSGASRIALATGCPVIPVGQWGPQDILPAYSTRLSLLPRKTVRLAVGDPVDLQDLLGQPQTPAVVQQATDRIMAAITGLVGGLRGETPPRERFDPRKAGLREIGRPDEKEHS